MMFRTGDDRHTSGLRYLWKKLSEQAIVFTVRVIGPGLAEHEKCRLGNSGIKHFEGDWRHERVKCQHRVAALICTAELYGGATTGRMAIYTDVFKIKQRIKWAGRQLILFV